MYLSLKYANIDYVISIYNVELYIKEGITNDLSGCRPVAQRVKCRSEVSNWQKLWKASKGMR